MSEETVQAVNLSNPPNYDLAEEILKRREDFWKPKGEPKPRGSNWPSSLSSCSRQMVYHRAFWEKKDWMPTSSLQRFEVGKERELGIKKELTALGFELVASNLPMNKDMFSRFQIYGRLDSVCRYKDKLVLIEIKTLDPFRWNKINSLDDMEKDVYMRKWIRQIQIYLLGYNIEHGLFILDDCKNHWKPIPVTIDYDYAENLLKVVEEANKHLPTWNDGNGTLPDRISYGEECKVCDFSKICLPGQENEATQIDLTNPEVEKMLERRHEIHPLAKEFKELDASIKEKFQGHPRTIVGKFLVISKESERTVYDIPEEVKAQYQSKEVSHRISIQKLDETKIED